MQLRDTGGDGPPVLFLHGAFVDGSLWDPVVDLLPGRRCLVPTLPLGSHVDPVADRSVLTPFGVVDLIADEIARLGLTDLTVVGNDTGGALAQLLVVRRPEGISRLVLTPCDALEVFPPTVFKPLFAPGLLAVRAGGGDRAAALPARAAAAGRVRLALQARERRDPGALVGTRAEQLRDRARRRPLPQAHATRRSCSTSRRSWCPSRARS